MKVKIFINNRTPIWGLIKGLIRSAEFNTKEEIIIVKIDEWNEHEPQFIILKVKEGLEQEVIKQVDTFGIRAEVVE